MGAHLKEPHDGPPARRARVAPISLSAAITVELANASKDHLASFQWAGGGMDYRLSIELSLGGLSRSVTPDRTRWPAVAKYVRARLTSECQGNPAGAWRVQWNMPFFHFLFVPVPSR